MQSHHCTLTAMLTAAIVVVSIGTTHAQKPAAEKGSDKTAAGLGNRQQQIAKKYARLEQLLLKLSRVSLATDPQQAELLKQAAAQSRDRLTLEELNKAASLVGRDDLSALAKAIEKQKGVQVDLKSLLKLLQSEDRARRHKDQRARVREYLRRLNRIIREEKGIQGRTEGGDDTKRLAERQGKVAEKTGRLQRDVRETEEDAKTPATEGDAQSGDDSKGKKGGSKQPGKDSSKDKDKGKDKGKSKDAGKGEGGDKKKPGKDADGKQGKGKGKSKSKGKDGQPKGKPGKGSPKQGSQKQGGGQSQQQAQRQKSQQQDNPAHRRIEQAQKKMREAQKRLQEAKRDEAGQAQKEALRQLEKAKADLERILRQLREEEIDRVLATLEVRFRRMLEDQRAVNESTVRLSKVPAKDRDSEIEISAGRLSRKERQIVLACDKALALLREEGSAVALPEAVEQLREDMNDVVVRLGQTKIDQITQGVQQDIVGALEEVIDALKKAQRDLEKKKRRPPPGAGGGGQPTDPPLVDALAELRMIRALQMRVNRRTKTYSKIIQGSQIEDPDLLAAMRRLAGREEKIFEVTRDIAEGKNR